LELWCPPRLQDRRVTDRGRVAGPGRLAWLRWEIWSLCKIAAIGALDQKAATGRVTAGQAPDGRYSTSGRPGPP
jgi:hypothetical protein